MLMRVSLLEFWVCEHLQHLKLGSDLIIEIIKASRAMINFRLLWLCRRYLDVLINWPEEPVCCLSYGRKQCDATNLGCLMQAIMELSRPQLEDHSYRGTTTDLLSNMQSIPWYGTGITSPQNGVAYNTASHAGCGISQKMSIQIAEIVASLKVISLPS